MGSKKNKISQKILFIIGIVFSNISVALIVPITIVIVGTWVLVAIFPFICIGFLILFIIGEICIWASGRPGYQKILASISPLLVFIVSFFGTFGLMYYSTKNDDKDKRENETILIPQNYHGPVHVIFDVPCGKDPIYENKRRIYEIPLNGILFTQFSYNTDQNCEIFTVDKDNRRSPLRKFNMMDGIEIWEDTTVLGDSIRNLYGIFHTESPLITEGYMENENGNGNVFSYYYLELFAGTYYDLNSESFNYDFDEQFRLNEVSMLKKCKPFIKQKQ